MLLKMLEKLLMVSCRSSFLDDDKIYPPLGMLYLHQVLKENRPNIEVTITDEYNGPLFDFQVERTDMVGVSIMTPQSDEALKILHKVKQIDLNKKVIAGGPHCKHYADEIEKEPWDHIVTDDGERAILEIVDGTDRRIITDFIPAPEFKKYAVKPNRLDNRDFLRGFNYILDGRDSTTAMFGKGCPERCTFCEDAMTAVKWTPLDKVTQELDDIVELGYRGVYIFDDIFAIALPKTRPIAEELKKRDIIYRCNAQARYFTKWGEDFAKMLRDTGCYEIAFGAETGSQKILDNIQKRTTVEMNYRTVQYAEKYGIVCKAFILLGLPGEDWDTLHETENFIRDSGIDDFQCAVYMPYRGTQIRDAIDRGEVVDLTIEGDANAAYGIKGGETAYPVRTAALSSQDLKDFRNYLVNKYRPGSHQEKWKDKFFDTHLTGDME